MVHRTLNITQRSRGKVSGASGKILDPHRQGNWGRGEAWQPLTKPLTDMPQKWRQEKQGPPSPRLPVFLGSLWHITPTEEWGNRGEETHQMQTTHKCQTFSPEESRHYPFSKLQITTHLQDKAETSGRRHIPSTLNHRAGVGPARTSPIPCFW